MYQQKPIVESSDAPIASPVHSDGKPSLDKVRPHWVENQLQTMKIDLASVMADLMTMKDKMSYHTIYYEHHTRQHMRHSCFNLTWLSIDIY